MESESINSNGKPVDVTIVIPVFNEEKIIESAITELIGKLKGSGLLYEIILSENGSTDATLKIIGNLEKKFPQVRHLHTDEPNYGKALRRGILEAKGEIVICDEIDLCDVNFYKNALKFLQAKEADLVIGSKTMPGAMDQRPWMRRVATRIITFLLRILLGFKGTDTHGLKAMRRSVLEPVVNACLVDKDLFASEMVIRAERTGVRIKEVPIVVKEKRKPTIKLTKRVPNVIRHLAILFWAIRIKG